MKPVILVTIFTLCIISLRPLYADQTPEETFRAITKIRAQIPENARTATSLGTEREGSGVVIDANGLILTIGYLIIEADSIEVIGLGDEAVSATFVAYDHHSGFGLIRCSRPLNVTPMRLGESSEAGTGDPVLVAGYGGQDSVHGVRIITRKEFAGNWEYLLEDAIFTSPPYSNFGGAALVGRDGRLLGIGSLFTQVDVPEIGKVLGNMFVPIDHLKPILGDLITTGRSPRPPKPWLGLYAEETHDRVFVLRITSGGPSEQAGIQPNDIILTVNKVEVTGLADFYKKVWSLGNAGATIPLGILRGIQIRQITVRSADRSQYLHLPKK